MRYDLPYARKDRGPLIGSIRFFVYALPARLSVYGFRLQTIKDLWTDSFWN